MRIGIAVVTIFMLLVSCKEIKQNSNLKEGTWRVELDVMDNQVLPFNLKIKKEINGDYIMQIINAEEVITVDEIVIHGDSIILQTPVFEGYLAGTFRNKRSVCKGEFR